MKGTEKRILRDSYNPFPKIPRSENFPNEFIYVGGTSNSFADSPVTSELRNTAFLLVRGALYENPKTNLTFTPLLKTRGGELTGSTSLDNFWTGGFLVHQEGLILTGLYTEGIICPKPLQHP